METLAPEELHPPATNSRSTLRFRHRSNVVGYTQPEQSSHQSIVSNNPRPTLPYGLTELAQALLHLDLQVVKKTIDLELTRLKDAEEDAKTNIKRKISGFVDFKKQAESIEKSEASFTSSYLTEAAVTPTIWRKALRSTKNVLSSKNPSPEELAKRRDAREVLLNYVEPADNLRKALIRASRSDLLCQSYLSAICNRWRYLDDLMTFYLDNSDMVSMEERSAPRAIPKWATVKAEIIEAAPNQTLSGHPKANDEQGLNPHSSTQGKTGFPKNIPVLVSQSSSLFLVMAIASIALFGVGYGKSSHKRGSTADADFWFMSQASTAQLISLASSTLLEWSNPKIRRQRRPALFAFAIAAICSLLTVPLYLLLPKEWASFLGLVATMIQSVLILQRFIFESSEQATLGISH